MLIIFVIILPLCIYYNKAFALSIIYVHTKTTVKKWRWFSLYIQPPMGKVKMANFTVKLTLCNAYHSPMRKVNRTDVVNIAASENVSIPYGKGKVIMR